MTVLALGVFLGVFAPQAKAQGMFCNSVVAVPELVRVEGRSERVGDILIQCQASTPGVSTPAGQVVPAANVHVRMLGTTITSRQVTNSAFPLTEALLIVDEAGKPGAYVQTQTYCGKVGAAPDNGPSGAGVCAIIAPASPQDTYNGLGGGTNYGDGHPNIFQSRLDSASEIVFPAVPMDPPGLNQFRTFRITNVRIDATTIDPSSSVVAYVFFEGTAAVALQNNTVPVAFAQKGIRATQVTADFGFLQCVSEPDGSHTQSMAITISEGFRTAWRPRNAVEYVNNYNGPNTLADWIASYDRYAYNGSGSTNNLTDVAQNLPDYHYFSETGFLLATTDTKNGINLAGKADYGTRIAIPISAPPAGSTLTLPTVAFLSNGDSNSSGVMVMTSYSGTGTGPYAPVSGSSFTVPAGGATVVYEVLFADPGSLETATIVPTLTYNYDSTNNLPSISAVYVSPAGFAPQFGDFETSSDLPRFQVTTGVPYGLTGIAQCGVPPTGQISISAVPIGAGFSLTGPASYSGTADAIINSVPVGNYSIVWTDIPGNYTTPPPETRAVVPAGMAVFGGTYGFPGTINITANVPGAQFQLTGPGGTVSGTAPASFSDMLMGNYSVTWTALPDLRGAARGGGVLTSGGTLSIDGNYVDHGTVQIFSSIGTAPFVLTGPNGYEYSGTGAFFADSLPVGSYTITWGTASYYGTPAPETATLVGGQGIYFFGTYATSGTIYVTSTPSGASFDLAIDGFHRSGVTPQSYPSSGAGLYTVTWFGPGAPAPETKALIGGTTVTFDATYLTTGNILLTSSPTGAGYSITGPGGTFTGVTPGTISSVLTGAYTVTWNILGNNGTPPQQTLTLNPGATLTFNGAYVTTGTISATSNISGATFSLSGSGGATNGTAGTPISGLPVGVYTITWNAIGNNGTPLSETKTLTGGSTLGFTGTYITTGTISATSNISGATFSLSGPGGTTNGTAGTPIPGLPVGPYTITWNTVPGGYLTPSPETKTLTGGATLVFVGNYTYPGTISITSYPTGAGYTISAAGGYSETGAAPATINGVPVGQYTINWNSIQQGWGPPPQETKSVASNATTTFDGTYSRPVIVVPDALGSWLLKASDGDTIWADRAALASDPCNFSLLRLSLAPTAFSPAPPFTYACGGSTETAQGENVSPDSVFTQGVGTDMYAGFTSDSINRPIVYVPYDWRRDLATLGNYLAQQIGQHAFHSDETVDVVAHGLGGLVVRAYLAAHTSDTRIHSVVYLGTPHAGYPKSFGLLQSWQGRNSDDIGLELARYLNFDTMNHASANARSLYATLPRFDFFGSAGASLEPFQTTFAQLANQTLLAAANDQWATSMTTANTVPRSYSINGTNHPTVRSFSKSGNCVVPVVGLGGDGLVPVESAAAFGVFPNFFVDSNASGLPANQSVLDGVRAILTGSDPSTVAGIATTTSVNPDHVVTTLYTCNPLKMRVTNSANYLTGRDASGFAKQDIPGSQYFNFPNNEAVVVDGSDTLQVALTASGYGFFTVGVAGSKGDIAAAAYSFTGMPMAIVSKASFVYQPAVPPSLALDLNGDGTTDFIIPANGPPPPAAVVTAASVSIDAFGIPAGTTNQLKNPLENALKAIDGGSVNNAQNSLNTFLQKVSAMNGKNLTSAQTEILTAFGNRALQLLQ